MKKITTKSFDSIVKYCTFTAFAMLSMTALAAPQDPTVDVDIAGGNSNWTDIEIGCRDSIAGLCVADANLISPGQGDAYDVAAYLRIDGQNYEPLTADLTGQFYTGAPVTISGLEVTQAFYVSPTDSVLRTFATFTNPGGSDINVPLRWQHNLGADGSTTVVGSASGDTLYTTADGWVVTDDAADGGGDPTTSFALFGPGATVTTTAVSLTTDLDESGFQGVVADYDLTVPAGQTRTMMWFNGLDSTSSEGQARGAAWDTLELGDPLLVGLSNAEIAALANWSLIEELPESVPVPTMSLWSLLIMMLALLFTAAIMLKTSRKLVH